MKTYIKGLLLGVLMVLVIYGLVALGMFIFKSDEKVAILLPKITYEYSRCYDNDNANFSQEYVDKQTDKAFVEAQEKYGNCFWVAGGRQDIIGCTGDLFYEFECV